MTDYQITIDVDTPEEAEEVMNKINAICQDIIEGGGDAAKTFAQTIIPKRSGRLAGGTSLATGGDSFHLTNDVYYGPFVDKGHRLVVRVRHPNGSFVHIDRGFVSGKNFSEKIWAFVEDDINQRCMALLDLK